MEAIAHRSFGELPAVCQASNNRHANASSEAATACSRGPVSNGCASPAGVFCNVAITAAAQVVQPAFTDLHERHVR